MLSLYPDLCTPVFVACSTNGRGSPDKNSSCAVMYMDVGWICGGVAHSWLDHKAIFHPRGQRMRYAYRARYAYRVCGYATDQCQSTSGRHRASMAMFLRFRKLPHFCEEVRSLKPQDAKKFKRLTIEYPQR